MFDRPRAITWRFSAWCHQSQNIDFPKDVLNFKKDVAKLNLASMGEHKVIYSLPIVGIS